MAIASRFGIIPTLIGCGLASILGGLSFWTWPVQRKAGRLNEYTRQAL
ncbi:MAG TPA: hypothetical protein VF498_11175 [Anaerolineales bacterium]